MEILIVIALIFAVLLGIASLLMYRLWEGLKETYSKTNDPVPKDMIVAQVVVTFSAIIFPLLGLGYTLYRLIF